MILTVTLNPALDLTYTVDTLTIGDTHRVVDVAARAGGKGVNVSRVLHTLDAPTLATGVIGGPNGTHIARLLAAAGVSASFAPIEGETRRTVVVTDGTQATSFWEPGPCVSAEEWDAFLDHYRALIARAGIVVLAGSLPRGIADDAYATLIALAHEAGVPTLLDADGKALLAGLEAGPAMIKPNGAELAAAAGVAAIADVTAACAAAEELRAGRPTAVVATLGASGLVASTVDGRWHAAPAAAVTGNSTGAGDACAAALAAGMLGCIAWPDLLANAVACSAAAAAAPVAGDIDPANMRRLRAAVVVEQLMPTVPTADLVLAARASGRGVAAFNVITLEHAEAVVAGAEAVRRPVILQVSENAVRFHGGRLGPIAAALRGVAGDAAVDVGLHLDHIESAALLSQAFECGFSSVMFDASGLPYEENVLATKAAAELVHGHGLWLESELGVVGGKDGQPALKPHDPRARTDPAQAASYVETTGVDALAVAVGSVHAMATRDAVLDQTLIAALRERVAVPLVLHGSSGVPDEQLRAAVRGGIAKVNIGTALNLAFTGAVRQCLDADPNLVDPRGYLRPAREAMAQVVARFLTLLAAADSSAG